MRYFRQYWGVSERDELSYEEALRVVLGSYKDNDEVRSWLEKVGRIECAFSDVVVEEENR